MGHEGVQRGQSHASAPEVEFRSSAKHGAGWRSVSDRLNSGCSKNRGDASTLAALSIWMGEGWFSRPPVRDRGANACSPRRVLPQRCHTVPLVEAEQHIAEVTTEIQGEVLFQLGGCGRTGSRRGGSSSPPTRGRRRRRRGFRHRFLSKRKLRKVLLGPTKREGTTSRLQKGRRARFRNWRHRDISVGLFICYSPFLLPAQIGRGRRGGGVAVAR